MLIIIWLVLVLLLVGKVRFRGGRCIPLPPSHLCFKEECLEKKEIIEVELTPEGKEDEFAIGFANWIRVCKLKQRPYDFDDVQQLLEIYKKEKGL